MQETKVDSAGPVINVKGSKLKIPSGNISIKTNWGEGPVSLARWKCPEVECPNQETLEAKSNCPGCGSKAEQFSFMDIDDLLSRKRKEARLREQTLFTESTDFQQLDAKIKESLRELAILQSRKFPKENDDIKILTCLSKISVLQTEQTMRVMLNMAAYFQKLFGSL